MNDLVADRRWRHKVHWILARRRFAHPRTVDRAINVERRRVHAEMHELVRHRFRNRVLRYLRRIVSRILRRAVARLRAQHEDYRSSSALGHLADDRLRAEERAISIDLELEVEIILADFDEALAQIRAGVVDQHGDRPELTLDCFDR